jgi:hypothetical protein
MLNVSRTTQSDWAAGCPGQPIKSTELAFKSTKSALAGLEAALRLIDHVDAALAAHETVVPMAAAQRFQ